jgi:hypothetical protein
MKCFGIGIHVHDKKPCPITLKRSMVKSLLFPFHVPYGILPFEDLSRRYVVHTLKGG